MWSDYLIRMHSFLVGGNNNSSSFQINLCIYIAYLTLAKEVPALQLLTPLEMDTTIQVQILDEGVCF